MKRTWVVYNGPVVYFKRFWRKMGPKMEAKIEQKSVDPSVVS